MDYSIEDGGETEVAQPRRDSGFSLTEIVIAMTLMALVMVPLMLATVTLIRASTSTRTVAKVETVLANAADRVNRAPESCDYDDYVQAAALSQGWSATAASASYQWYAPGATSAAAGTWNAGACPGASRPDGLVQLVTISVTSPNGVTTRQIQVVKSDV